MFFPFPCRNCEGPCWDLPAPSSFNSKPVKRLSDEAKEAIAEAKEEKAEAESAAKSAKAEAAAEAGAEKKKLVL